MGRMKAIDSCAFKGKLANNRTRELATHPLAIGRRLLNGQTLEFISGERDIPEYRETFEKPLSLKDLQLIQVRVTQISNSAQNSSIYFIGITCSCSSSHPL